jgi:hypothetical protein
MPLGAIAEGIFQLIIEFFIHIIFEIFIKGTGYIILRYVFQIGHRKKLDPDGALVIIAGIIFWLLVAYGLYRLFGYSIISKCC